MGNSETMCPSPDLFSDDQMAGGYSYELVDDNVKEMKELECPICCLLMKDAQELSCHHAMCLSCLEKWEKENIEKNNPFTCPQCCDVILKDKIAPSGVINRLITTSIKVKCENHRKGCQWIGMISDIMIHIRNKCDFTIIKCINQRCGQNFERKQMDNHAEECLYRIIGCLHCQMQFTYIDQKSHLNECQYVPIKCINDGCSLTFPKKEIDNHLENECEMKIIECKYSSMGCEFKNFRKTSQKHNEDFMGEHMDMMFNELKDTRKELQETKKQLAELSGVRVKNLVQVDFVNFDENLLRKSWFFADLSQASTKAQELAEKLKSDMDVDRKAFDDSMYLFSGELYQLNANLSAMVEEYNKKLYSLRRPFYAFVNAEIKNQVFGRDALLSKEDEDQLFEKFRICHKEKMKILSDFVLVEENYRDRFAGLLSSLVFNVGYQYEKNLLMKIDIQPMLDSTYKVWTLEIFQGDFDCKIDFSNETLKVTLDKFYYNAAIASPFKFEANGLPFSHRLKFSKVFEFDLDTLSESSVNGCALLWFTNCK